MHAPNEKLIKLRGDEPRKQVADSLGITPQMLGAIERGQRQPSLQLAIKIAKHFKTPVEEIFFEEFRNIMCPTA